MAATQHVLFDGQFRCRKASGKGLESPPNFYNEVKLASHLFTGITDATMTHGEGWHFCRLGRLLERADKTSRILDVSILFCCIRWRMSGPFSTTCNGWLVLRSASAFEMYRKRHGRISPIAIVEFLLLDGEFPRAVRFCLNSARDSLHAISGTPVGSNRKEHGRKVAGADLLGPGQCQRSTKSCSTAVCTNIWMRCRQNVNQASTGIYERFFATRVPETRQAAKEKVQ